MMKPKGTYDIYGKDGETYNYIFNVIEDIMNTYNYEYFRTPIFESSDLFHRGVGETTDIVTKETYDFKDRGDRNITLRPEGTAGLVRSYVENKMYADNDLKKTWYFGTMYRYERPQKGRYREFTQFGCEVFGSNSPMLDAEVISIPVALFEALGLTGIKVKINTLGDTKSREKYKEALLEYFRPHINDLCSDCKERFEKNPLRILDCKVDKDNDIIKKAPRTIDYLNEESKKHFDDVLKYLNALEINYEVDSNVIRGLDYYTNTVFEIEADIEQFGAQKVMCGGGRYNKLVESLGGPYTPAVGFAIGIDRLMQALKAEDKEVKEESFIDTFVIPVGDEAKEFAFALNATLRLVGLKSDIDYLDKNIKGNFKQSEKLNAKYVIIIGEDELKQEYITIRNMHTKKEEKIENSKAIEYILKVCTEEDECNCNDHECSCNENECNCNEENETCDSHECKCHKQQNL